MKSYKLIIITMILLLIGCITKGDRTDEEMFKVAYEIFKDYLFEYGIDESLFVAPIVRTFENGDICYKWIAFTSSGGKVGMEILVGRKKCIKPEMTLIGKSEWSLFIGSKHNNQKINR